MVSTCRDKWKLKIKLQKIINGHETDDLNEEMDQRKNCDPIEKLSYNEFNLYSFIVKILMVNQLVLVIVYVIVLIMCMVGGGGG